MEIFRKIGKNTKREDVKELPEGFTPVNAKGKRKNDKIPPYLKGRSEWNSYIGWLLSKNRIWQIVALFSLLIALTSVGGIVHIGSQSKYIPYIVEVDKLGKSQYINTIDPLKKDDRIIFSQLASFIQDARIVTSDALFQRNSILNVYSMLQQNAEATVKMNEFLNGTEEQNPFVRATKETVTIQITSILEQTESTWQVEWIETVWNKEGIEIDSYKMKALLQIDIIPPTATTTLDEIFKNPIGLFIKNFNWSKEL